MFGIKVPEKFPTQPDKTFKDGQVIKVGKLTFVIIATPGHTPGSVCFWEENKKICFTGDTIFEAGGRGRTDFPGGSAEQM